MAGKDAAWNHSWGIMWWIFTIPTVLISLDFAIITSFFTSSTIDHVHYVSAVCYVWVWRGWLCVCWGGVLCHIPCSPVGKEGESSLPWTPLPPPPARRLRAASKLSPRHGLHPFCVVCG